MVDQEESVQAEAGRLLRDASRAEVQVSADVRAACSQAGGQLQGWEYRLKSDDSLVRKIRERVEQRAWGDVQSAARSIKDVLRYTVALPPERYSSSVVSILSHMIEQGYSFAGFKNAWAQKDLPYRGINTWLRTPTGVLFEVQFHTPESWTAKEQESHPLYVQWRSERDVARASRLFQAMLDIWNAVATPDGAESLDKADVVPRGAE